MIDEYNFAAALVRLQREADRVSDASAPENEASRVVRHVVNKLAWEREQRAAAVSRPCGGEVVFDGAAGTFRRIGDADDSTPLASLFNPAAHAERKRFAEAEQEFAADCSDETGRAADPEKHRKQILERAELRQQSHMLAHMLESAGTVAYRADNFQLWIWHVHSLEAERIPNFRRICFLPYVAAQVRASKLAGLEFFMQRHPFCRFWTFTSGQRVGIDGLTERVQDLHKRLNRLNKALRKRYGVELVFRSTELGTVEFGADLREQADAGSVEFDANGEPLFHPHAHCVVHSLRGYIPPKKWAEMVAFVWRKWGHHWDAGQIVRNAREACKYVTKPGDMLKLSPAHLARVEAALHGLRLVSPLGTLKAEIRARKDAGKVLRRKRTHDGCVWREVLNHNAQAAQDKADQDAIWNLRNAAVIERYDAHVAGWEGTGNLTRKPSATFSNVLARLAPAVGPRGIKEPRVIFGSNCGFDRKKVMNHPLTARLWSQTLAHWEDESRRISVHTGTPTGTETRPLAFVPDLVERLAPPGPPVFAEN